MTKSKNTLKGMVSYSGDPIRIEDMNNIMSNVECVMCGGSGGWSGFDGYVVCKVCNGSGIELVKPTNQAHQ